MVVTEGEREREKSKILHLPSFVLFRQATLLRTPLKYTTEFAPAHSICRGGGRGRSLALLFCSWRLSKSDIGNEAGNARGTWRKFIGSAARSSFVLPLALKELPFAVYY